MASSILKRTASILIVCGLGAGIALAQGELPSKEDMKSKANDALKDAQKSATDAAKDLEKKAKDAMGGAGQGGDHGGMPDQKMMEEMMKSTQPGAMHEWLKKWEGEWDMVVKSYWSPGAPADESKATASTKMIMGGRYVEEHVNGSFEMPGMGVQKFEGRSIMGYDNAQKKFMTLWIDSMTTGFMLESGTVDSAGKVMTTEGENFNPMHGKVIKSKSVATIVDDKTRTLEMWMPGPDGNMYKSMEITYTRK